MIQHCALRELKEETGLTLEQINIIPTRKDVKSVALFLATTDSLHQLKIEDEDELSETTWVKIEDAYDLLVNEKNRAIILKDAVDYLKLTH